MNEFLFEISKQIDNITRRNKMISTKILSHCTAKRCEIQKKVTNNRSVSTTKRIIEILIGGNARCRWIQVRSTEAFFDISAAIGRRQWPTSVFPLPRCIVSSSSRFRAPRRKLQNTNICCPRRPDILMRLRPTYAPGYCVSNGRYALLTHIWFLWGNYFYLSLSFFFLINEFYSIWNNYVFNCVSKA